MKDIYFSIGGDTSIPSCEHYALHTHDEYEIYMFLEGDSSYVVEEKNYDLSPGDMIIIRKNEMHRVFHKSNTKYTRLVLMVSPMFFKEYCDGKYEGAFSNTSFGGGNKLTSDIVRSSGLYDAIMRLKKYSENYTVTDAPIARSVVTEILYLINKISTFEAPIIKSVLIKNVISYINKNLQEKITLETLSEEFFVSKYHLCHCFKKSTGLSVYEYIKQKRLVLVNDLIRGGASLSDAASKAGFCDYSSFYRAYVKQYNESPKSLL